MTTGLTESQKAFLKKERDRRETKSPMCPIDVKPYCPDCAQEMEFTKVYGDITTRLVACSTETCRMHGTNYHLPTVKLKKYEGVKDGC